MQDGERQEETDELKSTAERKQRVRLRLHVATAGRYTQFRK